MDMMGGAASNHVHAIHTVGDLRASFGGPSRSVTAVSDALDRAGASVTVVTSQSDSGEVTVHPTRTGVRLRVVEATQRSGFWAGATSAFGRAVAEEVERDGPAVVQNHGLWVPTNRSAALATRAARRPYLVSPKGMLSECSLRQSKTKKRLAWHFYQRRALQIAAAFQVTAEHEAEDIRRLGLRQPVAVIPHGVEVPAEPPRPAQVRSAQSEGERTVLFLSRIHPIKGLPDLVEAWGLVRPDGWRLVVAGPDEDGHRGKLKRQARALGLSGAISFPGPISDEDKWDVYGTADLFVLPTHSENFGIVVAEALAAGLPVLTTHGAPWRALETHGCGWWVGTGAAALAPALREATAAPPDVLRAMGARGRSYVETHLSWDRSAAEHLALYEWLLGRGPRPTSIHID